MLEQHDYLNFECGVATYANVIAIVLGFTKGSSNEDMIFCILIEHTNYYIKLFKPEANNYII